MALPLIVHVIYRLGVGGLENGLINLINHLPEGEYRHAIICLTEATAFKQRLRQPVTIYELNKRPGQDFSLYWRLYRLLQSLQPTIVHTRNLATLECQLPAWLAGVPVRIHGEHGWDVFDPHGRKRKYLWLRRALRPLIHRYIPLSQQLEAYLIQRVKVAPDRITRICNGVDTERFYPANNGREPIPDCPFADPEEVLIGTVGRMHGVKDQPTLVRAFVGLLKRQPGLRARLILVGDGPLRAECRNLLQQAGIQDLAWLPGELEDIPRVLRGLDVFVLPSQAEGISNTILEAMATGLPVVATAVGGNPELVQDGVNGCLIPPGDWRALASALERYCLEQGLRKAQGARSRKLAVREYRLEKMVAEYQRLYQSLLEQDNRCKDERRL